MWGVVFISLGRIIDVEHRGDGVVVLWRYAWNLRDI